MILDIIIQRDVRIICRSRLAHFFYIFRLVNRVSRPLAEIGRFVGVAQITKDCIRLQPFLVRFKEIFETFGSQYLFSFLSEQ